VLLHFLPSKHWMDRDIKLDTWVLPSMTVIKIIKLMSLTGKYSKDIDVAAWSRMNKESIPQIRHS